MIKYNNNKNDIILFTYMKWIYLRWSITEIVQFIERFIMVNGKYTTDLDDEKKTYLNHMKLFNY